MQPECMERVNASYKADGCYCRSEFIEKAINFYCDFLAADSSAEYLPQTLAAVVDGRLKLFGERLGKLLFKLSVEEAMIMHIIAADSDLDMDSLRRLRNLCVQDVSHTNGQISFGDILRFQKEAY
jgi:hypothetical protein